MAWCGTRQSFAKSLVEWALVRFQVFIENEAGSNIKNHHDEKALTFQRSEAVSRAYPFPYGFIIGTQNADGDCLDCFVISKRPLRTGEIVECEPIGMMEQTEDALSDHNAWPRWSAKVSM
jgi:inorganic pyrophosphatase